MTDEEQRKMMSVATMLAAAYWRGRLDAAGIPDSRARDAMIDCAAKQEADKWCSSARIAIS